MDARPKSDMKFEVGKPISVELTDGRSMQGFVHAEDKGAGLLCLELIPSSEIALVSTVNIKNASASNDITEPRKWPSNPTVDVAKVRVYEQSVFDKREAEFNLLGAGVTATAQATFDTLHKTLPCKWDRDIIVILGTVKLAPPYNSKSISGDPVASNRVKMVLEREAQAIKSATEANGRMP